MRLSHAALAVTAFTLIPGTASASVSGQWALQYLKAQQCWSITRGGGVTVAVVDTGVSPGGDLAGQLLAGADFTTSATSTGDGQTDIAGHGTAMAAEIAGTGTGLGIEGLAPGVKILPVRFSATGQNDVNYPGAAIKWAVDHGAGVINLAVTSENPDTDEASAVQYAVTHNVVVVAATGNNGVGQLEYPAAYTGVIAVSGIQQNGTLWTSSNYGSGVALAAPAAHIFTEEQGQTGYGDGTSNATAYVSAAAALVRAAHPSWTAGQVIRDLIDTADEPAGQTGRNDQYGYGVVDPLKALQAGAPTETTNPLLAAATASSTATPSASSPPASAAPVASGSSSSSNTGLIIGIVAGAVIVLGGAGALVLRRRRPRY